MRSSGLVRLFVAILWVSTVLLVCVPALEAATVNMTAEEFVGVELTYEAASGESNRVAVAMTTDLSGFIVSDTGVDASGPLTLTAGAGCTSVDPQIALCEHNLEDVSETPIDVVLVLGDSADLGPGVGEVADTAWVSDACGPFRPGENLPCRASIYGGEGVDSVFANDVGEHLVVGDEPSLVLGGPGRDFLHAGEAGSRLIGGRGDDALFGGAGRDTISGGGGEDTIRGGAPSRRASRTGWCRHLLYQRRLPRPCFWREGP